MRKKVKANNNLKYQQEQKDSIMIGKPSDHLIFY